LAKNHNHKQLIEQKIYKKKWRAKKLKFAYLANGFFVVALMPALVASVAANACKEHGPLLTQK
jgi:hypothetical protein